MKTVINMSNVSGQELTSAITQDLEREAETKLKNEKSGTFTVGDNTATNQILKFSSETITNIESRIELTLQTYMRQKDRGDQIIEGITMYPPCLASGQQNPSLDNTAYITMMATDVTNTAVQAIMDSTEVTSLITKDKRPGGHGLPAYPPACVSLRTRIRILSARLRAWSPVSSAA